MIMQYLIPPHLLKTYTKRKKGIVGTVVPKKDAEKVYGPIKGTLVTLRVTERGFQGTYNIHQSWLTPLK